MNLISRLLIALALLGTSSLALADRGHGDHDRRGQRHAQRDHHQDRRHVERRHVDYRRHDAYRSDRHDNRRYGHHRNDRGHGYRPVYPHYRHTRWVRGDRYHGSSYGVSNYGYYQLRQPPRGYHWVRADNDFLLVAIATGVILDLALR